MFVANRHCSAPHLPRIQRNVNLPFKTVWQTVSIALCTAAHASYARPNPCNSAELSVFTQIRERVFINDPDKKDKEVEACRAPIRIYSPPKTG